jgi:hypothetical protein
MAVVMKMRACAETSRGIFRKSVGHAHANPLFGTWQFVVEFADSRQLLCETWLIPKTMFAQVYVEGKQYLLNG